jgi:hypothetical protein
MRKLRIMRKLRMTIRLRISLSFIISTFSSVSMITIQTFLLYLLHVLITSHNFIMTVTDFYLTLLLTFSYCITDIILMCHSYSLQNSLIIFWWIIFSVNLISQFFFSYSFFNIFSISYFSFLFYKFWRR